MTKKVDLAIKPEKITEEQLKKVVEQQDELSSILQLGESAGLTLREQLPDAYKGEFLALAGYTNFDFKF